MDRFIEQTISREHFVQSFLKSNMDRFIDVVEIKEGELVSF